MRKSEGDHGEDTERIAEFLKSADVQTVQTM